MEGRANRMADLETLLNQLPEADERIQIKIEDSIGKTLDVSIHPATTLSRLTEVLGIKTQRDYQGQPGIQTAVQFAGQTMLQTARLDLEAVVDGAILRLKLLLNRSFRRCQPCII